MNNSIISVPFHSQSLSAVLVNDLPFVAMKPICESIGIDWEGQRQKINRHPVLSQVACMVKATCLGLDGKSYIIEMLMLPIKYLNGWLFGIDSSRVKPEAKGLVIEYQKECFDVLAEHFMPKSQAAIIPLQAPRAKISIKGGLELYQQDAINDLINERMLIVPQDRKAAMKIRMYSAINTKFGTKGMKDGYKNIQPEHFDNIISLIARLPLDEELYLTLTEQEFKVLSGEVMPKQAIPTDTIAISLNGGTGMMNIIFNGKNDNPTQDYYVNICQGLASITKLDNERFKSRAELISDLVEDGYIVLKKAELLGRLEA